MTQDSIKCVVRRHKHKISNNRPLDKEESEMDKSEHQRSVLGIISTTTVNGGRPKGSTLKNKKNVQERMDEAKIRINSFFLEKNKNFKRLPVGTFHILHNYVMTNYDLHETSLSIPVDTTRGRTKYGTTEFKPWPLDFAYQIEPIILRYIQMKQYCSQTMTRHDVIDCASSLVTGSTLITAMNILHQSNSKSLEIEFCLTWYRNFMSIKISFRK